MMKGLAISAPYPEAAALALATRAIERDCLSALFSPSRVLLRALVPLARAFSHPDLGRRLARDWPATPTRVEVLPWYEITRVLIRDPRLRRLLPSIHDLKGTFDDRVSKSDFRGADVLFAMPEAALRSFRRRGDVFRVFHEVDGHPRTRNDVLRQHYGRRAEAEFHPDDIVRRIEAELDAADLVLCPSNSVVRQMRTYGLPADKLHLEPLGVDFDAFSPTATVPSLRSRRSQPLVLYVGQISWRKGIPFLLRAASNLSVQVRMLGPIVDPTLLAHLPDNVTYEGTVSAQGVSKAMRDADAFVLPTLEDSFGLVLLEAAASGLPVITTSGAGASEVLDERDCDVVPAGDASALRRALRAVRPLDSDARIERYRRIRGRSAAGVTNTWSRWADNVLEVINSFTE